MDTKVTGIGWEFILEVAIYCDVDVQALRNMTLKAIFKLQELGQNKLELEMQMAMGGSIKSLGM